MSRYGLRSRLTGAAKPTVLTIGLVVDLPYLLF
jgi:hypothetical protein